MNALYFFQSAMRYVSSFVINMYSNEQTLTLKRICTHKRTHTQTHMQARIHTDTHTNYILSLNQRHTCFYKPMYASV